MGRSNFYKRFMIAVAGMTAATCWPRVAAAARVKKHRNPRRATV